MKVLATQQTQTRQAETPLHIMPILEARQKEIALAGPTGGFEKAVEKGIRGLKAAGRFALTVAGAIGGIVLFSDANSAVLGHQVSSRHGTSGAGQNPWQSDWRLQAHARR